MKLSLILSLGAFFGDVFYFKRYFSSVSKQYFKKFDTNRDGAISQQELLNGMRSTGLDFGQEEAKSVFEMADVNTDGGRRQEC